MDLKTALLIPPPDPLADDLYPSYPNHTTDKTLASAAPNTGSMSPTPPPVLPNTQLPITIMLAGSVLVLAYAPPLAGLAAYLWSRKYYQFFPLLLLGAGVLGYDRSKQLGEVKPGSFSSSATLACLAWLLLTIAIFLSSHWLGAISFLFMLVSCCLALGGYRFTRSLAPAIFVMAMILPPPMGLDQRLASACQRWATGWASQLLDFFSVLHLREGNILELPNKRLLVEQACNGMNSLLPGMGISVFVGLWFRHRSSISSPCSPAPPPFCS